MTTGLDLKGSKVQQIACSTRSSRCGSHYQDQLGEHAPENATGLPMPLAFTTAALLLALPVAVSGLLCLLYLRAPKKHISKNEEGDIPYKPPYNEA